MQTTGEGGHSVYSPSPSPVNWFEHEARVQLGRRIRVKYRKSIEHPGASGPSLGYTLRLPHSVYSPSPHPSIGSITSRECT